MLRILQIEYKFIVVRIVQPGLAVHRDHFQLANLLVDHQDRSLEVLAGHTGLPWHIRIVPRVSWRICLWRLHTWIMPRVSWRVRAWRWYIWIVPWASWRIIRWLLAVARHSGLPHGIVLRWNIWATSHKAAFGQESSSLAVLSVCNITSAGIEAAVRWVR